MSPPIIYNQYSLPEIGSLFIEEWPAPLPIPGGPKYRIVLVNIGYIDCRYAMTLQDAMEMCDNWYKELISKRACPECGAQMKKRTGKYGTFWGCSAWSKTKCQGKLDKNGQPTRGTRTRVALKKGMKVEEITEENTEKETGEDRATGLEL